MLSAFGGQNPLRDKFSRELAHLLHTDQPLLSDDVRVACPSGEIQTDDIEPRATGKAQAIQIDSRLITVFNDQELQQMKRTITLGLMFSVLAFPLVALTGCGEESSVTTQQKIKTPEGTTTITDKKEVKSTDPNVKTDAVKP